MSTIPDELADFVKSALGRGLPRAQITAVLRDAGWTKEQTQSALGGFAETEFPIPIPRPRPYLDARDAFMYLVLFSALYMSAFQFGSLLFDIIDTALPDPASERLAQYLRQSMRWSISVLVVTLPIFVYMSFLVGREIARDPNKRQSKVRRWLTYMTLFFAASVLTGDLIALVYSLLSGDVTTRFLLKLLVVGFIAGTVFWYYLTDIRREV